MPTRRRRHVLLMVSLALYSGPLLAASPPEPGREMSEQLDDVADIAEDAESDKKKSRDLLIVPIPQASPSLGTGLTLAASLFYNPNRSKEPWITGVGLMHTSNGSWAIGALHKMTLSDDRIRATAFAGYADVNVDFFGIGPSAGDRDLSVELNEKGFATMLQGQVRAAKDLFVGPRFQYLDLTSSINVDNPAFPDAEIPRPEFKSRLSKLGPVVTYDRRDNSLNPGNGELINAAWLFSLEALGSDFSHDKFTLEGNIYRPVGRGTVLAVRASICGVSQGGPFYDLCLYGFSSDLRGYETGRYRDGATWASQVELRQHLFGRFGAVIFAGIGGVAPNLEHLDDSKFLPAAGAGIRFQPSRQTNINLRVDYAVGKDSNALYIGLGEAF